jgi:hypothetical protein
MNYPLSSIDILSLSSHLSDIDLGYINQERNVSWYADNLFFNLSSYTFLNDVADIVVDPSSVSILTKNTSLSSIIEFTSLLKTRYYVNDVEIQKNSSVAIKSSHLTDNQYLITAALSPELNFNIIPLKNNLLNIEENTSLDMIRTYDGIYKKNDDIFLQYKSSFKEYIIQPDEEKTIYFPEDIGFFPISSLTFIEDGFFNGSCPANSDIIQIDRFGYSQITDSGYDEIDGNGEFLCIWASGNTLMERWYDPLTISQSDAFTTIKADSELVSIIDIPTDAHIGDRTKLVIHRTGYDRNTQFINSLSSNLSFHFKEWNRNFYDSVNNIGGFIVGNYSDINAEYLEMDGTIHAHVPPENILHSSQNITMGLWAFSEDWSGGIDTQFWGNFSNSEGYGIFYNTGATNELITFPSNDGIVYGFNFRGYKIFDKTIANLSNSNFSYITTDYFGNRWIYDKNSNQIIKLTSDDIFERAISFNENVNIKSIKINSQNSVFVHDSITNSISSFDLNGQYIDSLIIPSPNNDFEISSEDNLVFGYGNLMVISNVDDVYTIIGKNVYKNNSVWYHFSEKIQTIQIDYDDNVYVFSGQQTLTKLTPNGDLIWKTLIDFDNNSIVDDVEMNFVKEYDNKTNKDFDVLWVIFNKRKFLVKINVNGKIVKRINLVNVVNLRNCGNFDLTVRGDFTGFNIKRKFERSTSDNPTFSLKMNLKCGNNNYIFQQHVPAKQFGREWVNLIFTHKIINGQTVITFYINGVKHKEHILNGVYLIDYGTKVSPFIIGGNSGKLGAKNVERSLNDSGFFKGRISNIFLYDKVFSDQVITSISRYKHWNSWRPLTIITPTPPRTYLEKIEKFHLNKYPGFKSNKFNIKISGLPSNVSKKAVTHFITTKIDSIKPAHIFLNEILFR